MDEDLKDEKSSDGRKLSRVWQRRIAQSRREHRDFLDEAKSCWDKYKSEDNKSSHYAHKGTRSLNIFYSNTQTMHAALYARHGKADVRRLFAQPDPVGREAAMLLERALKYQTAVYPPEDCVHLAILDHQVTGRGIVRVMYEPVIEARTAIDPMTGGPIEEEGIGEQKLQLEYVNYRDFLHDPAKTWKDCDWVAFKHVMDEDDLDDLYDSAPDSSDTYGNIADIPRNWSPDDQVTEEDDKEECAEVWEVWDKKTRKRLWMVEGCEFVLRVDDDPYTLENFFPMEEPLAHYRDTSSMIPRSEYFTYADQARDLDEIVGRIAHLTRTLRRRGVYNKAITELKDLTRARDNQFVGVSNWGELMSKGGLEGHFQVEDISTASAVLQALYVQRDMLIQQIYEVTGISDIQRGSSSPYETLGAQEIKGSFGSHRLKSRQAYIQRWIRGLTRIQAEMICEHFEPQVLSRMTAMQVNPQVLQVLKDDKLRSYTVNIQTDSTVFEDAAFEQKTRLEALTGISAFLERAFPILQQFPPVAPVVFELLLFGVRSLKQARELEDDMEQARDMMMQAVSTPQGQQMMAQLQKGDDKGASEQAKAQSAQQVANIKAQTDLARESIKAQAATTAAQTKAQAQMQIDQAKLQGELAKVQLQADRDDQQIQMQNQAELLREQMRVQAQLKQAAMQAYQKRQQEQQRPRGQN